MSEYQYYEWQTCDRPLTASEQQAVDRLSSHIEVTATRAVVTYEWGDFKHDPAEVLARYFDAHLYVANWGSRRLMLRFPKGALDENAIDPYCDGEHLAITHSSGCQVLDIVLDDESGMDWFETDGVLASLTQLRGSLLEGDHRLLYLAWLKAISLENPPDFLEAIGMNDPALSQLEPPVPPGLDHLTAPLKLFADFFEIDPHLIAAAAQHSPRPTPSDLRGPVSQLTRAEADDFLLRIAGGEPGAVPTLKKRLRELAPPAPAQPPRSPRTLAELFAAADQQKAAFLRRQAAQQRRQHETDMQALAERETESWQQVETLLQTRTASSYNAATALLVRLKQLSEYQSSQAQFTARLRELYTRYQDRAALIRRWREQGLVW